MSSFIVNGGYKLSGSITIDGAKNAALPVLAATILNGNTSVIRNCPDIADVRVMTEILERLGCKIHRDEDVITVDSSTINTFEAPENLVREMRSSIVIMGALLARLKKVNICYPGGCEIGLRPIDLHIKGLKQLGVNIIEKHGFIHATAENIVGTNIHLDIPSVGATQNIMFASIFCEGSTFIRNAAKEPEIICLQDFLNKMGAKIRGAGTNIIRIDGVKALQSVEFSIIPDRIIAGTYLTAVAIAGGSAELKGVEPEHIQSVIGKLNECGCDIKINKNKIYIKREGTLKSIDTIRTQPYPGFPTDMQPQIMALLCSTNGTSIITETIFENRFKHSEELIKMGADIRIDGRVAIIKGVKQLTGATVTSKDLRGGAALVLAGLGAEGTTIVEDANHIDRGYHNFDVKLKELGADIVREE